MDTYLSAATTIEPKLAGRLGGGRPARNRPVLRGPEPWEFELLRLIAEQGAIPFDQLARFLGADAGQAESVVKHLTEVGYVDYGRFLHDEPHWAWLSCRGARLSGTGFRPNRPRVGAMARMRAVNEVRLHISSRAPEARWICHRSLVREQGRRGHRPNAVIEIRSERHAIVVRLSARDLDIVRDSLETDMARYDAVIVFAMPSIRRRLEHFAAEHHWPKLVIRDIPNSCPAVS
jgi:hypothetical protein